MNSFWNESLIIFAMELVSTCSDNRIKIRVFGPISDRLWVKLNQTWPKLLKISEKLGFGAKLWKMLFCECLDLVWPTIKLGLTRGILVILAEKGTSSAPVPERVVPRCFRCSHGLVERKWYFRIFLGVQHANRGQTKYDINNCLFFIWYLECNERCQIKNVISNFVTPKLECGDCSWTETGLYLLGPICCSLDYFPNAPLSSRRGERRGFFFLRVFSGQR